MSQAIWIRTKVRIELFVWSGDDDKRWFEKAKKYLVGFRDDLWWQVLNHFNHSNHLKL